MKASFSYCALLCVVICGCGAETGSPGGSKPAGNAGSAGSDGTPGGGCTKAPHCGSCGTCFEQCFCTTQNSDECRETCSGGQSGSGGAAGSGSAGTAGAGTGGIAGTGAGGAAGSVGGTTKYTIKTDSFTVAPGQERFVCQNIANPFPGDVGVIKSESFMTAGSHHMFVFYEPNATRGAVQDCSGVEFKSYVHSAQTPQQTLQYPAGVGRVITKNQGFRVLMHYLNTSTSQPITAQVSVDFHAVEPSAVANRAASIFLNNLNINVRAKSTGQATQTCTMPRDMKVIGAVSHMHQYATRFRSVTSTGVTIYEGTDWDEPVAKEYVPPLDIKQGTRVTTTCDYNNFSNTPLTFGESAEINEMCILSGTYYPAPDNTDVVCFF